MSTSRTPYYIDVDAIAEGICALAETHCMSGTADELLAVLSEFNPGAALPRTSEHLWYLLQMLAEDVADRVFIEWEERDGQELVSLHSPRKHPEFPIPGEAYLADVRGERFH